MEDSLRTIREEEKTQVKEEEETTRRAQSFMTLLPVPLSWLINVAKLYRGRGGELLLLPNGFFLSRQRTGRSGGFLQHQTQLCTTTILLLYNIVSTALLLLFEAVGGGQLQQLSPLPPPPPTHTHDEEKEIPSIAARSFAVCGEGLGGGGVNLGTCRRLAPAQDYIVLSTVLSQAILYYYITNFVNTTMS